MDEMTMDLSQLMNLIPQDVNGNMEINVPLEKQNIESAPAQPESPENESSENMPVPDPSVVPGGVNMAEKCLIVNPRMYVYFDCEFTSLRKDAELISIGLCDAEGHSFYAEFTDFTFSKVSEWTFTNVLKKMTKPSTILTGDHWQMTGTTKEIRTSLGFWLEYVHKMHNSGIQLVTDCGHYDMVLLIDLMWKDAINMPEWITPAACDINQELANLANIQFNGQGNLQGEHVDFNPYHHAFNLSRDEFASHIQNAPVGLQHNSMYDAYVIRAIHQSLYGYECPMTPFKEAPFKEG